MGSIIFKWINFNVTIEKSKKSIKIYKKLLDSDNLINTKIIDLRSN